jgi:hypothetical protein
MCEKVTQDDVDKVTAVKGARVSEFGGKSLNAVDDHSMFNPALNHEKCSQIHKWY